MGWWREVTAVAAGDWHSVGLRADGTVVAAGNNRRGQCNVTGWRQVRGIAAGYLHTIAVTHHGQVLATGDAGGGPCRSRPLAGHRRRRRRQPAHPRP